MNAIDLGLPSGTKWTDCNVGATKPEEYGSYFAWGDIVGNKSSYGLSTQYYQTNPPSVLPIDRDPARQNMGGSWRMPTKADFDELVSNTTTTWTTQNGVEGRLITSKINGKTLFFPAAGSRYGVGLNGVGSNGVYWSASLYASNTDYTYFLYFDSDNFYADYNYRAFGFSVRAVC